MTQDSLPDLPPGDRRHLPAPAVANATALSHHNPLLLAATSEEVGKDDEIDLLAYWRILLKRKWLVLGVIGGAVAIALLLTLLATPLYRAVAVLQIEKQGMQVVRVDGNQPGDESFGWDPEFLQTQYELIRSRSLAERVASELKLDDAAIARLTPPGWWERLTSTLRPQSRKPEATTAKAANKGDYTSGAGVIRGGLEVDPVRNARLVRVSFVSPSAEFSARAANAVADGFIAAGLERRFGASSYAKTYLESQLALAKSRLEESERKVVTFAQKENLVITGEKGDSLSAQNLTQLNSALAGAQDQRIRAQARWQQASSGAMPADMIGNSNIRSLQQQKGALQGQYQLKLQTFKPDYPEMQQLKSQITELDRQIAQEISGVRASVKAEYDAAARQESMLKGQIAALRDQTLDVDSRSITYNILKREVDTNRQLYDDLLQRYKQIGAAGDVRSSNVSIIDRAEVPRGRFKPSLATNLLLGILLGAVLGVLLAFVLEFLDDTLKTPQDVEQKLRLSALGVVPKIGAKETIAGVSRDSRSVFSEAYRSVRTALQFTTDHGVPRTLLVTSAGPGEGKSTTALALARNMAQLGKRVLVIDADLRKPSLHRTFGNCQRETGLSNLLAGACTLSDAVQPSGEDGISVILSGPLPPNPAELLSGSKLVSLLTVAAESFDQVVIDSPPVIGLADAPILANACEGTLLVVCSGQTKINAAQASLKRLMHVRARVVGALLTKYDARATGYGYGGGYYQSYYAYGGAPQLTRK